MATETAGVREIDAGTLPDRMSLCKYPWLT